MYLFSTYIALFWSILDSIWAIFYVHITYHFNIPIFGYFYIHASDVLVDNFRHIVCILYSHFHISCLWLYDLMVSCTPLLKVLISHILSIIRIHTRAHQYMILGCHQVVSEQLLFLIFDIWLWYFVTLIRAISNKKICFLIIFYILSFISDPDSILVLNEQYNRIILLLGIYSWLSDMSKYYWHILSNCYI